MNWAALALALLQLAASLLEWSKRRAATTNAQEVIAAQQALRLLELSDQGQKLRAKLDTLSDPEAQLLWDQMIEVK